jgi:hypothetical protein
MDRYLRYYRIRFDDILIRRYRIESIKYLIINYDYYGMDGYLDIFYRRNPKNPKYKWYDWRGYDDDNYFIKKYQE